MEERGDRGKDIWRLLTYEEVKQMKRRRTLIIEVRRIVAILVTWAEIVYTPVATMSAPSALLAECDMSKR